MPRRPAPTLLDHELREAAAQTHGLVTTRQLLAHGIDRNGTRQRVRAGLLFPVHRAVWSLRPELDLLTGTAAARLALGGGTACLGTAAALLGLDGAPADDRIHLSLPPEATRHQLDGVVRHWLRLQPSDIGRLDGVDVTTPQRLLLDAGRRWRREEVVSLADSALRHGLIERAVLADVVELMPRRVRPWLEQADGRAESPLETRLRLLLHDAGLGGAFVPQWTVEVRGRVVARVDFGHPGRRLGLECDGRGPHELPEALFRDRHRADDLAALGWRLIRFTWEDVTQAPAMVLARVRGALGAAA